MYSHEVQRQGSQMQDSDVAFFWLVLTTDRHRVETTRSAARSYNPRLAYREACSRSRLLSQGYDDQQAGMIAVATVHRVDVAQLAHPNLMRRCVERFLVRKLQERRAAERRAQHRQLVAVLDRYRDTMPYRGSFIQLVDAAAALHIPRTYLAGRGQNIAVYATLIARVQEAIARAEMEADYASEESLRRAESGYYTENLGEPLDARELFALEQFEAQLAAAPSFPPAPATVNPGDEIPF